MLESYYREVVSNIRLKVITNFVSSPLTAKTINNLINGFVRLKLAHTSSILSD